MGDRCDIDMHQYASLNSIFPIESRWDSNIIQTPPTFGSASLEKIQVKKTYSMANVWGTYFDLETTMPCT